MFNIDKNKFQEIVDSSVASTFENMMFMDTIHCTDESRRINNPEETHILINHPYPGEIVFHAPEELVLCIAETLFMLSNDEVTEKIKKDVMNEVLNTISGRIMAKITPDDISFKLGLPEESSDIFTLGNDKKKNVIKYLIDDEYLIILEFYDNSNN